MPQVLFAPEQASVPQAQSGGGDFVGNLLKMLFGAATSQLAPGQQGGNLIQSLMSTIFQTPSAPKMFEPGYQPKMFGALGV